jgi:hypothetical protein
VSRICPAILWLCGVAASCVPTPRGAETPELPATVVVLQAVPTQSAATSTSQQPLAIPSAHSEWLVPNGQDLPLVLREAARRAVSMDLLPVAFIGRPDCEPCESLKKYRGDPRMQEALDHTFVVEINLDRWAATDLMMLGFNPRLIPVLFVLDGEGHPSGRSITGGAWGDDIPENMAPPLKEFFSRALAR